MSRYLAVQIKNWDAQHKARSGLWIPSRPENFKFDGIVLRLKLAFGVLIGRYDALDWNRETIYDEVQK